MTDNQELQAEIRNLYYITGALISAFGTLPMPQRQDIINQLQAQANDAPPKLCEQMKSLLESLDSGK